MNICNETSARPFEAFSGTSPASHSLAHSSGSAARISDNHVGDNNWRLTILTSGVPIH